MTFEPDCTRLHIHDMKNSKSNVLIRKKQLRDYPLHWHDCFEIELILSGRAQHVLNGASYEIGPGDVYLLRPTDFHEVHLFTPVTAYNLMFQESIVEESLLHRILHSEQNIAARLCGDDFDELAALMKMAVHEFDANAPYREEIIRHLLDCIFIRAARQCAQSAPAAPALDAPLRKTLTYLHGHFREDPPMAQTAQRCGFNPSYFSALFHRETGRTYKEYLSALKLDYARKLLLASDLSVTEVCYACGFHSLSHFLREYKQKFGASPRTARRAGRESANC